MKIAIHKDADALYFRIDESRIVDSEEVRPGVILDYDENDVVVGVEFLRISERAGIGDLSSVEFESK